MSRSNIAGATSVASIRRVRAFGTEPGETEDGHLFAADLNTPRRLETLAGLLADRGCSDARIEKLLGANLRRVFADAFVS